MLTTLASQGRTISETHTHTQVKASSTKHLLLPHEHNRLNTSSLQPARIANECTNVNQVVEKSVAKDTSTLPCARHSVTLSIGVFFSMASGLVAPVQTLQLFVSLQLRNRSNRRFQVVGQFRSMQAHRTLTQVRVNAECAGRKTRPKNCSAVRKREEWPSKRPCRSETSACEYLSSAQNARTNALHASLSRARSMLAKQQNN